MTSINFAKGKVILVKTGYELQANYLRKGITGWKIKLTTAPIITKGNTQNYSINYLEFFSADGHTMYFGYIPNNNIYEVRLRTSTNDSFPYLLDIRYKVNSNYWLIPLNSELGQFTANISVIMKDGKEIFYPFN